MELLRIAMNHSMLLFLCCVLLANECRGPQVGDAGEEGLGHKCVKACVRCLAMSSVLGGLTNVGSVEGIRLWTMNGLNPSFGVVGQIGGAPGPSQQIGHMAPAPLYSPYAESGKYASSELCNKNSEFLMQADKAEADMGREKEIQNVEKLEKKSNELLIHGANGNWLLSTKPHATLRTNNRQQNVGNGKQAAESKAKQLEKMRMEDEIKALDMA